MLVILFLLSMSSMLYVDFKKWACRPVEFKGQGPHHCLVGVTWYCVVGPEGGGTSVYC